MVAHGTGWEPYDRHDLAHAVGWICTAYTQILHNMSSRQLHIASAVDGLRDLDRCC